MGQVPFMIYPQLPTQRKQILNQDDAFDFLNALTQSLKHLDVSRNYLEAVPTSICKLNRLLTLDLTG